MSRPLTKIIGRPHPLGSGWLEAPMADGMVAKRTLEEMASEGDMFRLRFVGYDKLKKGEMGRSVREAVGKDRRARIKATGTVVVETSRTTDPRTRRKVTKSRAFPADPTQPFEVSFPLASLLLAQAPWCYLFEEMDDGTPDVDAVAYAIAGGPPSPQVVGHLTRLEQLRAQDQERLREQQSVIERQQAAIDKLLTATGVELDSDDDSEDPAPPEAPTPPQSTAPPSPAETKRKRKR